MTTIQETPAHLTINSFSERRRLIIGLALFLFGLLIALVFMFRVIQIRSLIAEELTELPQFAQSSDAPSSGEVVLRLGYEGTREFARGGRPVVALGFLSFIAGIVILARYKPGHVVTFDKHSRQLLLVEPDRFFRPQISHFPFEAISAVRVERDRSFAGRGESVYSVQLEIDLNDSTQADSDFVYKKPILLSRFDQEQVWAEEMVAQINRIID